MNNQNITNTTHTAPFTVDLHEIERRFREENPDETLADLYPEQLGAFLMLYALDAWARSPEAARAVYDAWADGMRNQDRPIAAERQAWLGLDLREKRLDASIAQQFVGTFITHIGGRHA